MNFEELRDRFFLPCVIALIIILILASMYGLKSAYETSRDLAREFLVRTTHSIKSDIETFLTPALNANIFMQDYFALHPEDYKDFDKLEVIGKSLLDRYTTLRAFNIGFENGDFLMVKRNQDDSYSTKSIFRDSNAPYIQWKHYDHKGNLLKTIHESIDDYDPRNRPWYIGAITSQDIFWTQIYTLFTDQDLGITIGAPITNNDQVIGVFSFDIKLQGISSYIDQLEISDNGEAIIVDYRHSLIAFATPEVTTVLMDTSQGEDASYSLFQTAYQYATPVKQVNRFKYNGKLYFVYFEDLTRLNNNDWAIGIVVPESDFLQGYLTSRLITIFAITLMVVMSIMLNYYRYSEKRIKSYLIKHSEQDPLTGLMNRRSIIKTYETFMHHKRQNYLPVVAIMGDIDFFKKINDTYGHHAGDTVLKEISALFTNNLREQDIICRWGGEEFLVLLSNTELRTGESIAEKLRKTIADSVFEIDSDTLSVTMSFGVAHTEDFIALHQLVSLADTSLYKAKDSGRNQVVTYRV